MIDRKELLRILTHYIGEIDKKLQTALDDEDYLGAAHFQAYRGGLVMATVFIEQMNELA